MENIDFTQFNALNNLTEDQFALEIKDKSNPMLNLLVRTRDNCRNAEYRETIPEALIEIIDKILQHNEQRCLELTSECFRLLRNACAGCARNQQMLHDHSGIFKKTQDLCVCLTETYISNSTEGIPNDKELTCLRCSAQFLGNAAGGHTLNQQIIWREFKNSFSVLLSIKEEKLCEYTSMVVYNCMKHAAHRHDMLHTDHGLHIFTAVMSGFMQYSIEWGMYMIEDLLLEECFLQQLYEKINQVQRTLLLDVVATRLSSYGERKLSDLPVHEENMLHIARLFVDDAKVILGLKKDISVEDIKPMLVRNMLDCLCAATSLSDVYPGVKSHTKLLTAAIHLLGCMKALGETENSVFKESNKITQSDTDGVLDPVYGIKCNLIRLVSNMSFKNRPMQDLVRELGGINLILDHTNIDTKNPFMTQWSIFAIRNLCDKNMENQAVISGLKLEGLGDKVEELKKYGVEAEIEGDKVVIKKMHEDDPERPLEMKSTQPWN